MLPFQACMDQYAPISVMLCKDSSTIVDVLEKVYSQDVPPSCLPSQSSLRSLLVFYSSHSSKNLLVKRTMMHLSFSFGSVALVLSFLFGSSLCLRPPVDEFYRRNVVAAEREAKGQSQKRQVCVNDTVLQDFEMDSYDTYPFCSALLGYQELTTTATVTTRTSEFLGLHSIIF